MLREGRQHGMVRTQILLQPAPLNPRPKSRAPNRIDAPPAAGALARAPSKPTRRCGKSTCPCCHAKPAWKSMGKTKGKFKVKLGFEDELRACRGAAAAAARAGGFLSDDEIGEDMEGACENDEGAEGFRGNAWRGVDEVLEVYC
ncbi:hypothetical protein Cni_G06797 [Canna indica]|nr:hypothetical protein Cni_G06797 [Canna indica]